MKKIISIFILSTLCQFSFAVENQKNDTVTSQQPDVIDSKTTQPNNNIYKYKDKTGQWFYTNEKPLDNKIKFQTVMTNSV
jgi:hypothetical protein